MSVVRVYAMHEVYEEDGQGAQGISWSAIVESLPSLARDCPSISEAGMLSTPWQ